MKIGIKSKKGFSILEVAVALALAGILGTGFTVFSVQTINESQRSYFHTRAIQQLENVGFWICRDAQMAQYITPGPTAGFPLKVDWEDENSDTYNVTFELNGSTLTRTVVLNGGAATQTTLAEHIDANTTLTNCNYTDELLTLNATAALGDWNLSRTFQIKKRPNDF